MSIIQGLRRVLQVQGGEWTEAEVITLNVRRDAATAEVIVSTEGLIPARAEVRLNSGEAKLLADLLLRLADAPGESTGVWAKPRADGQGATARRRSGPRTSRPI